MERGTEEITKEMKNDNERQTQKEQKTIIHTYKTTGDIRQAASSSRSYVCST